MSGVKKMDTCRVLGQCAEELLRSKHCNNEPGDFILRAGSIVLDYHCQKINKEVLGLLLQRAEECHLKEKINALTRGEKVNESQGQSALHTALRVTKPISLHIDKEDIMPHVFGARDQMKQIAARVRAGLWLGCTGKAITDVVNIGIGGSDFGPRFCIDALKDYLLPDLRYHFISDVDPKSFQDTVKSLFPETTLFIVSSKSFTTYETLYNANKALAWIGNQKNWQQHFIAITANTKKAEQLGFINILPIWHWVGGRYSLCSAINLITCIAVGYDVFMDLLAGAHGMDCHFQEAEPHENMPVILALLGTWNINYLSMSSLLLLIYARQLELLVPYIQQLDMESNGKGFDRLGKRINQLTGPIVWGGMGNQAQHSYYQLLSQGNHKIAADFISLKEYDEEPINNFCKSQIHVLSKGASFADNPWGDIPGGMPINHIQLDSCTPYNLGALIALYEHKVYVQSVLWNTNPFDQPGVESAKLISRRIGA